MKKQTFTYVILISLFCLPFSELLAQVSYTLSDKSQVKVSGTSTIHDWEMLAKEGLASKASIKIADGKIVEIPSLSFSLQSKALKSGKSSMDKNAYEALHADEHPEISFQLIQVEEITPSTIKAKGMLNIVGKAREIAMDISYSLEGNQVHFNGQHDITFEQFSLKPPTAVFGTIKTGSELTLSFSTTYSITK
jgi:hypothetical protein